MKISAGMPALLAMSLAMAGTSSLTAAPNDQQSQNQQGMSGESAKQVIEGWPDTSKKAANAMMKKYGEPDTVTDSQLTWRDNGPWVRTVVYSEEIQHNFPVPHKDVMEQFINYEVPVESFSDLAAFDGSVYAYRTNGELSSRCDKEGANTLALNLANDIIEGTRSIEEARAFYAQTMQQVMQGEKPEYTQSLQFETRMASATKDPGEQYQGATSAQADASTSSGSGESEETATIPSAKMTGMTVISAEGEEVGEITEVIDEGGAEVARIQLSDGFLGIGATELTLPVSELSTTADGQIKTSLTRDQLEAMGEPENKVGGQGDDPVL